MNTYAQAFTMHARVENKGSKLMQALAVARWQRYSTC